MKKALGVLIFIGLFITLIIEVGSFVVNLIVSLIPISMHDWIPLIKVVLWILTFSFNIGISALITYIVLLILLALLGGKK